MKKRLANHSSDRPWSADSPKIYRRRNGHSSLNPVRNSLQDFRSLLPDSPDPFELPSPRSDTSSPDRLSPAFYFKSFGRQLITASGLLQLNPVQEDGSEVPSSEVPSFM